MRKITELTHGNFSAKIYRDAEWNEYRVKFFHVGSHLPDGDYFTDDESDARGTAMLCMQHMADGARRDAADAADADSETEELNIRLSQLFNWPDEAEQARQDNIEECLRPYRVQVDAETEQARQDVLAEIARLRRLIGTTPDGDIL